MEALVKETKLDGSQVITLDIRAFDHCWKSILDMSAAGKTVVLAYKTRLPVSSLGVPLNSTGSPFELHWESL